MYVVSSKGPMRPYSLLKKNKSKNKKKEREGASLDNKQTPFFLLGYVYVYANSFLGPLPFLFLELGEVRFKRRF